MINTYTKAILTVIAFALLLLIGQNYTYTKPAKAAFGDCGDQRNPCRMLICDKDAPEAVLGRCNH
jgi:hypothetical protein